MLGGERIVHPLTPDLKISKYKNKMNTADKNYVDRLHNQQVNELNEIKTRLTILEGKPTSAPDGTIHVELDTDKLYDILLRAYEDCLQQRQERRQEEDRQAEERRRQECEAKGERYIANVHEWRAAIARDYDEFFSKMLGLAKITDRRYRDIRAVLIKLLGEPPTHTDVSKPQSIFSNLPPSILPKLRELRHRLTQRICNYLTGSFTLHRGWTILTALLYFIFLVVLLSFRLTFSFSS